MEMNVSLTGVHVNKQDGISRQTSRERPAASAKSLGVTCAFFGMLVVIGTGASLFSGRLSIHIPAHALRGMFSLGLGAALFFLGTILLAKSGTRRN